MPDKEISLSNKCGAHVARSKKSRHPERANALAYAVAAKALGQAFINGDLCGWAALQIVAGLDVVRYGWSRMPLWLEVASALAVVIGIYVFHIVMLENSYASPVVKVDAERGHCVVSSGPYAWVRHPLLSRDGAVASLLVRVCHRHRADRDHRVARRLGKRNAESRVTWVRRLRQRREVSARAGLVVVSRPMSASLDIAPR